jgi:2,4-dichlorophenol 6-monooxygenase
VVAPVAAPVSSGPVLAKPPVRKLARDLGIDLATVVIGPGRAVTDLYYDWSKLREVDESGALLVRPDKHIGWRAATLPADPESALRDALRRILCRG